MKKTWKAIALSADAAALGMTGMAQAGSPSTGLGRGYYNGDVKISYVDAYFAAARTWDYFLKQHGRHGIHDDGVGPRLFTDVGPPDGEFFAQRDPECGCMALGPAVGGNAAWNTTDVVAHEMTHGITGMTAGLDLNGEAGGLNESTSDVFGTLVECSANNGKDRPDYTIGEGVSGRPLRYMDDPTKDGVSKGCWTPDVGEKPNHQIVGISNKFFYQLVVGSGKSQWGAQPDLRWSASGHRYRQRQSRENLVPRTHPPPGVQLQLRWCPRCDPARCGRFVRRGRHRGRDCGRVMARGRGRRQRPGAPSTAGPVVEVGQLPKQRGRCGDPGAPAGTRPAASAHHIHRQWPTPGADSEHGHRCGQRQAHPAGTFQVTFTAADSDGNTSTRQVSWEVGPGEVFPIVSGSNAVSVEEGAPRGG